MTKNKQNLHVTNKKAKQQKYTALECHRKENLNYKTFVGFWAW